MSRRRVIWLALAVVVGLAGGWWWNRPDLVELTPQRLAAARQAWTAADIHSYDMTLQAQGAQPVIYRISVRRGQVTTMTVDGEPAPPHVHNQWTIDGLFHFLDTELTHKQDPRIPFGVSEPDKVILRVRFDKAHHIPSQFLRVVLTQSRDVGWTITGFEQTH